MIGLWRHPSYTTPRSTSNNSLFRLIDEAFERPIATKTGFNPAVDVVETDDGFRMSVELAGMKPEDVTVEVHDGVLSVSGERKSEHEDSTDKYTRIERSYGSFRRQMALPEGVTDEHIKASMNDGVLSLDIVTPKEQKDNEPRRINISSASV
mmetsp:Transcript_13030/g.51989  ORF Transcript_13030/g.51989 Transcript_13030/m.51989 type:complete len:152 (+) Transcript_13030:55-510(+)